MLYMYVCVYIYIYNHTDKLSVAIELIIDQYLSSTHLIVFQVISSRGLQEAPKSGGKPGKLVGNHGTFGPLVETSFFRRDHKSPKKHGPNLQMSPIGKRHEDSAIKTMPPRAVGFMMFPSVLKQTNCICIIGYSDVIQSFKLQPDSRHWTAGLQVLKFRGAAVEAKLQETPCDEKHSLIRHIFNRVSLRLSISHP